MKRILAAITVMSAVAFSINTSQQAIGQSAEKLQWQFPIGRKVAVEMTQESKMSMNIAGQDNTTVTKVKSLIDWEVKSVDDQGVATVENTIQRMTMNINSPQMNVELDSNSEEEPEGIAKQVADTAFSVVGKTTSQTMKTTGEIVDVNIPDLGAVSALMSKKTLEDLTKTASHTFPEKAVAVGDTWKQESNASMPGGLGTMKNVATYTYKGKETVDGVELHKIDMAMEMEFIAPEGAAQQMEITEQDVSGKIYFNQAKGCLAQVQTDQDLTIEINVPGQTITQDLATTVTMQFKVKSE